jgi:hypothetical protein
VLIGTIVPLGATEYDEIAEVSSPPAGPVSDTSAAPLGVNDTENAPGSGLRVTRIVANVPPAWTRKASILFVALSVTNRKWPSGLKAREAASELLMVRKRVELRIL